MSYLIALLILVTILGVEFIHIRSGFAQDGDPAVPQGVEAFTSAGTLTFQGKLSDQSYGNPPGR